MRPARLILLLGSLISFLGSAACLGAVEGRPVYVAIRPNRPAVEVAFRAKGNEISSVRIKAILNGKTSPALFSLNSLETRLFADAADGRWDEHSLLTAALVASGLSDPQQVRYYEDRFDRLVDELRASDTVHGSVQHQAQAVFEFLHRRVLVGGYQLDATDLVTVLEHGRYNCVSASVLFNCLAERFGLVARGLEIPGHAMSRLVLADGTLNVETTCPEWFRLLDDPKKQADFVEKRLGFRPKDEATLREVSDVELVATIYYNRGVDLLGQKQFAEAVAANAKALELDPSSLTARGNLLATLNNWAIDLGTQGRYSEAAELLRQGLALDPSYETFKVNFTHVYYQWVEELCRDGDFRRALDVLTAGSATVSGEAYFAKAQMEVYRRWARRQFQAGATDAAFDVLTEAQRVCGGSREVLDMEVAEVTYRASVLFDEGHLAEAVALFDQGLARQPDSAVLRENRQTTLTRKARQSEQAGNSSGVSWGPAPLPGSERSI